MSPPPGLKLDLRLIQEICEGNPGEIQVFLERIRTEIQNYVAFGRRLTGKVERIEFRRRTHRLKSSLSYVQSPEVDDALAGLLAVLNQADSADHEIKTRYQEVSILLQELSARLGNG